MQKYIKTGLLIIVLVVPVLIFIFLQGYTTNHFDLPYYVPARNPATNEVTVANGDTTFYQLEDFSLPAPDSQSTITQAEFKDRITVVNAFAGSCDGDCEKILSRLIRVHALQKSIPSLRILTILTTQDTTFIRKVTDRQSAGWLVAHISENVYDQVLRDVFHLQMLDKSQTISEYKSFNLVDRQGFIRGQYDPRKEEEIERLLAEIRVLAYNKEMEQK